MEFEKFGIVYNITNKITGERYVGSTRTSLASRKSRHVASSKWNNCLLYTKMREYGKDNFEFKKICDCYCEVSEPFNKKKEQLLQFEQSFIDILKPELNVRRAYISPEQRVEESRAIAKKYYENNKEMKRQYYLDNREVRCAYQREYNKRRIQSATP